VLRDDRFAIPQHEALEGFANVERGLILRFGEGESLGEVSKDGVGSPAAPQLRNLTRNPSGVIGTG
jgi:hypothetical protein